MTRRTTLKTTAGWLAGTPASFAGPTAKGPGIKFCEIFSPGQTDRLRLAKQLGVNHAIAGVTGVLAKTRREDYVSALTKVKDEFAAHGITISGVESHPVPAEKIKLGLAGRDEEIENYKAAIAALKKVGIPMICYNFMAGLGWYRTDVKKPARGGALTSEFDTAAAAKQGLTEWGEISEEKMWANIEYFLKAVMPVADQVGMQMAAHPDDPPLSPLRGIGRILISAKNYERVMEIVPSKMNGVTFCQANFLAMKEDIYALAKKWTQRKKVFFVHFRDIEGDATRMVETFHDNGPTDMARMLKIYSENGFTGPMRPDHAPTMEGEENANPGYAMTGKVFAFGYMKGIMDGLRLPYE
jgi:mannonate dehydratase